MSPGLQFDEQMARRIEALYKTQDALRRRQAVLNALQLEPGERILDIGTGPGFVAYEMADAVGPTGAVIGVDLSEPMLALARERCAGKPWVDFQAGEATALPAPDLVFDVAVSVQVYEYVAEVTKALAEMYRVLRPGGRAVVVSTDWDSIVWQATNRERMNRVLAAFEEHCVYSDLPRILGPKLRQASFRLRQQSVVPQFNPTYDPDTFSYSLIDIIRLFAPGRNGVTEEEAEEWVKDLRQLGEREEYFFCLNQFLYLVTKPES
jgi:arsenite methyltransferase